MTHRVPYLDFVRCLAIILVITLHAMTPILTNTAFYLTPSWYFCMLVNPLNRAGVPLFFMISGYLMLSRPSTEQAIKFYKKNLPKLIIPLVSWNLIYCVVANFRDNLHINPTTFLQQLLNQGTSYHMWFVYTLLGIYLICPFLRRIVVTCTLKELSLLIGIILFPTTIRPFLNIVQPIYIYLFDPLMEGYLGYFLLGFCLGKIDLNRQIRYIIYIAGGVGYVLGAYGNLITSSAESIPLPFNGGYSINHYLIASAIFTLVRSIFQKLEGKTRCNSNLLAYISNHVFGVYWIHVLVLNEITDFLGSDLSIIQFVVLRTVFTIIISFGLILVIARFRILKRVLL